MNARASGLAALAICLLFNGAALAADAPKSAAVGVCDKYEPLVLKSMQAKNFLSAVRASGEYEETVLGLYPAPTFELGLMQNQAHHLSMQSSFDGWTQESLKALDLPDWLPSMGFDLLLALKGPQEGDRFVVMAMDLGKVAKRMGLKDADPLGKISDQYLLTSAQMFSQNFGAIDTLDLRNYGPSRAAVAKMKAGVGEAPSLIVCLGNNGIVYAFLVTSTNEHQADNLKKLEQTIKSLDFTFKPADDMAIAAARKTIRDEGDVSQSLACVRQLAAVGEYNAAVDELSHLRVVIGDQMPKPVVENNVARYDLYGLTLKNPDAKRWKLSQDSTGNMAMLLLEDRNSVSDGGIMVAVINMTFVYGPKAGAAISDPKNDEMRRNMVLSAGRGGILNIGGEIDSEQFHTFKELLGYEAVATITKADNLKVKGTFLIDGDCLVMIMEMVDARNFKVNVAEYDKVLDDSLQIVPMTTKDGG